MSRGADAGTGALGCRLAWTATQTARFLTAVLPPKSVASNRTLALDLWTLDVLTRHRHAHPPARADGYVFARPDGRLRTVT